MAHFERIITKTPESIEKDVELQLKGERLFEILSQVVIGICTHIIVNSLSTPPSQTYSECMKKLAKLGAISVQTSEKMASMVKMRNIVVHQYGFINYDYCLKV